MTFNIALSGLSAASKDLQVTGNNIANASTIGFKASRAEFADVYASSLLGSGGNQVGGGVKLANIAQQFGQGTISFTSNALDMAIDGNGFFVLSDNGTRTYTRAGAFGVDGEGFIVASSGARVQGFTANDQGTLSGVVSDLQINTTRLAPEPTTLVEASVNLDAREPVLLQVGSTISSAGAGVGQALLNNTPPNGYVAQTVDVVQADGTAQTVTIEEGASAAEIASQFSSTEVPGVSASATTEARLTASGFNNTSGTLTLSVNGIAVSGSTLSEIADVINTAPPGLGTVSAAIDGTTGDLLLTDLVGNDLSFGLAGGATDTVEIAGSQGAPVTLGTAGGAAVVGGRVDFTFDEGVVLAGASAVGNLFTALDATEFTRFELNTFDPTDQETYNSATSLTIFDSLGNPHVMSLYFVKQRLEEGAPVSQANRWAVYTQIDGRDVGDPDPNLPPPQNTEPTMARFELLFNQDGSLNPAGTDPILISNWLPRDENGDPNGAMGPQTVLAGGALPVADPPVSSNFELRLGGSTQTGSVFSADSLSQNGSTTGQLSGLGIDDSGVVSARFTNGENQVLGQIAIADFENVQGLAPSGDTAWIETGASGGPVISAPGAGTNGSVVSGALEDSNVDLSEQLVQLIIAQRNFQANARTISTADEINQTIINL